MDDRHTQQRPAKVHSRRDFLKTAGKLAVYTPPVLVAMSRPSHALFMKSNGGKPVDERYGNGTRHHYRRRHSHRGWWQKLKGLF